MTSRDRRRLNNIQAAIEAIRSHLRRGDLSDSLVYNAVRIRPGVARRPRSLAPILAPRAGY